MEKLWRNRAYALAFAMLAASSTHAELGQNRAEIVDSIAVPDMTVAINQGGAGCNTAAHEVWTPSEGGCSDIEYQKSTARVVSVTASQSEIESGTGTAGFTAVVMMANGKRAPAGIPLTWTTSNGTLSSGKTLTNQYGDSVNTLSGAVSGTATVTAATEYGGANGVVAVKSSAPIITSVSASDLGLYQSSYAENPSHLVWSSENQTAATKITISMERGPSYCSTWESPQVFYPSAGARSWWLSLEQRGGHYSAASGWVNDCPTSYGNLELCNGEACTSKRFSVRSTNRFDSM